MPEIKAIFWDVGGVLLTNAWDREQRRRAMQQFQLDEVEFSDRHEMVVSSFERGKLSLEDYLNRTVFYRPRPFARERFKEYMLACSKPNPPVLAIARRLAASGKYLMSTINNESRELNSHRIETFGLREIFALFVSSCYVGLRKPEEAIYQLALEITQHPANQCCFIDDRNLNVESARSLGMHAIEMKSDAQLLLELREFGIFEASIR